MRWWLTRSFKSFSLYTLHKTHCTIINFLFASLKLLTNFETDSRECGEGDRGNNHQPYVYPQCCFYSEVANSMYCLCTEPIFTRVAVPQILTKLFLKSMDAVVKGTVSPVLSVYALMVNKVFQKLLTALLQCTIINFLFASLKLLTKSEYDSREWREGDRGNNPPTPWASFLVNIVKDDHPPFSSSSVNSSMNALIKKKTKLSSYIKKFRWDRVPCHIWGRAS